jgi:hypothetical protein
MKKFGMQNYREIQVAANYEGCYHGNRKDDEYYGVLIPSLLSFVNEIRSSESV